MPKKHLKSWQINNQNVEMETQTVKTRALGDIQVIKPSELEDKECTVIGSISTFRSKCSGDKAAILDADGGQKADILSHIPFSRVVGYLPTAQEGVYIAVCKPRILLGVLVLLFVGAFLSAGMAAFLFQEKAPETTQQVLKLETNISEQPKTIEEIREERPNVTLPGWGEVVIAANSTNVCVNFYNPEKNAGCYYLTFELLLKNGGETESLYQSGLVEPGMYVTDITLSRPLPAGEYNAIVHMQPYTMSDPPILTNSGDVGIKLIAK